MTQDEIIEMARQAGASRFFSKDSVELGLTSTAKIEAFAKLVAMRTLEGNYDEMIDIVRKEEREACAKLVEGTGEEMSDKNWDSEYEAFAEYAARTIRARGEA